MSDAPKDDRADARGLIPSRNNEWTTPFTPLSPSDRRAQHDADVTYEVRSYSRGRRLVAIAITALAVAWVSRAIYKAATLSGFEGDAATEGALGLGLYVVVLFRVGVSVLVVGFTWAWSRQGAR